MNLVSIEYFSYYNFSKSKKVVLVIGFLVIAPSSQLTCYKGNSYALSTLTTCIAEVGESCSVRYVIKNKKMICYN